jgi:outer membrane cobalamin receptor
LKKNRYFLTIVSMIGLLFCSSVIWADDSDNNVSEEEVVVTASRTAEPESQAPGKTEVITKEDIEQSGATTVAEALTDAGETISTYGGQSGIANIQLDGSGSGHTLVLINGVPANTGGVDSVDLRYFPTAGIQRIEVAHGPLSALYGSSAMGGVVNIITDLTGEIKNEVSLSGGSFNTRGLDYLCQQTNWGFAVGGQKTDGYLDYDENYANYGMGQYNFFQSNDEYLKLYWQILSTHGQFPGSSQYPEKELQAEQSSQINLNGCNEIWGGKWEYKIYSQYLDNQFDYVDYNSQSEHQTLKNGLDAAGVYNFGSHELISGATLKYDHFDSTNSGTHSQSSEALYVQDSWSFANRFQLVSGLRWDQSSDFSSPISPRISLVDAITDQFSIKMGYGRTFTAPTIDDLYWSDAYDQGNPNLKAETGGRYDLIGEWKRNQQSLTVDIFQSNLHDGIVWEEDSGVYTPVNVDRMRIQGISLQWGKTWLDRLTTSIGYNWLDKEGYDATSREYNEDLNTFGKQQFNVGCNFKYYSWVYGMNWYFVRERSDNMANYDVLNLNVKYQMNQHLSFAVAADNSTDEYYEVNEGYPMPGRSYTLSTKYTF